MKPRSIKPIDDEPIVSVIIPVFNGAAHIQGAIESVHNQTFKDVEIIVVDDGSTDEIARLLGPWINNGTIRYVYQANKGSTVARNVGIRMAKGKFIKFLDSDDFLYPRQLELQVQHLENKPDFVLSATDYEYEYEDKTRQQVKINLGHGSQLARIIENNLGPIHCFLVRRSVIEKVGGFDESLSSCQDTDLWLRVMLSGHVMERLDYGGCCYRILQGSVSSNSHRQLLNRCKVFEKVNRAMLPRLNEFSDEVLTQLLSTNIRLFHRCFAKKVNAASNLPTALKTSKYIFAHKTTGFKKILLSLLGMKNIIFLKYIKASWANKEYADSINIAAWRQAPGQDGKLNAV